MMTDTTEVEKWTILHGELVREHDGPLVWSADYDALAIKLADAERAARYEANAVRQTIDQMKAEKARAEAAKAKLAKVEEDRDDALIALASARKQLERYIAEAEQRVATLEAALPAVYRLALADASQIVSNAGHSLHVEIDHLPTPTTAELMARIQTGEKE